MAKSQEVADPKVADQTVPDQEVAVKHELQIVQQFNQIRMKLRLDPNVMNISARETVMKDFIQLIQWRYF